MNIIDTKEYYQKRHNELPEEFWSFIEENLPNYHVRSAVFTNERLHKFLDNEYDLENEDDLNDYEAIKTEYSDAAFALMKSNVDLYNEAVIAANADRYIVTDNILQDGIIYDVLKPNGFTEYSNCTFEEYVDRVNDAKYNFEIVCSDTLAAMLKEYHKSRLTAFEEVNEDRYYTMLEVLPPLNAHAYKDCYIFFLGEAQTGDLHRCFVSLEDRYFEALRNKLEPDETIYQLLKDSIDLFDRP